MKKRFGRASCRYSVPVKKLTVIRENGCLQCIFKPVKCSKEMIRYFLAAVLATAAVINF